MTERQKQTIVQTVEVKNLGTELLNQVKDMQFSMILDVWRGGTAMHIYLSHLEEYQHILNQKLPIWHCHPIQVKHGAEYTVPEGIIDEDNILIIEDLLDSCETFRQIYAQIRNQSATCQINILCMFVKQMDRAMVFLADPKVKLLYCEDVSADHWIKFPWESGGEETRNNAVVIKNDQLLERLKGTKFDPDKIEQQKMKLIEHQEGEKTGKNLEQKKQYWQSKIRGKKWK